MKLAATASQAYLHASSFTRLVVVGDIHGNWKGLMEDLSHAGLTVPGQCVWRQSDGSDSVLLVQTGDVVDRGRYSIECFSCLQKLQDTAESFGHKVIRLLGNHELLWLGAQYDYRNSETDTTSKINALTKGIVDDILDKKLLGSYYTDMFGGVPILFTHAGLRKAMKANIMDRSVAASGLKQLSSSDGFTISSFINDMIHHDISECYAFRRYTTSYTDKIRCGVFLTDVIYGVGPERRGRSVGGVMWTDYHVLEQEASETNWGFVQVVGHTLQKGKIRATDRLTSICVDAGMLVGGRAYLTVNQEGRFFSHEKQSDDNWIEHDLTSMMCS